MPAAVGPPGVDPLEQPLPAAEIPALVVEKGAKVEVRETVVPLAITGRLAAQMSLDGVDQPLEAQLVLVGRVAPGGQVDVVEPEDDKRGLAGSAIAGTIGSLQANRAKASSSRQTLSSRTACGVSTATTSWLRPQAGLDLVVPLLARSGSCACRARRRSPGAKDRPRAARPAPRHRRGRS